MRLAWHLLCWAFNWLAFITSTPLCIFPYGLDVVMDCCDSMTRSEAAVQRDLERVRFGGVLLVGLVLAVAGGIYVS